MGHILGLDLGTNSIGWYLLDSTNKIIDRGVVIFPIGTNVNEKGVEKTKNEVRRTFRAIKRMLFRYKLRRKKLQALLSKIGLLPKYDTIGNLIVNYRVEGTYQAKHFYHSRTLALDNPLNKEDLGRIFLILNKYRGFKSNSKSIVETDSEEDGKVATGISQLKGFMEKSNARSIGEYFYRMYEKSEDLYKKGEWHNPDEPYDERAEDENGKLIKLKNRGIRREHGRYTDRSLYEKEFDLIWTQQKKSYPDLLSGSWEEYQHLKDEIRPLSRTEKLTKLNDFKKTNYWKIKYECIFYQRPLKSPKKYIGHCPFEQNKRTAPVSSSLYQEFRIYKQLADIRFTNETSEIYNESLPETWRNKLVEYLSKNAKLPLKAGKKDGEKTFDLYDLLDITNSKTIKFNFDNDSDDKYFLGDVTRATLSKTLDHSTFHKLDNTKDNQGISRLEKLWHLIYMKQDNEWLFNTLSDKSLWPELDDEQSKELSSIAFEDGYGAYSSKALKKIVPFLKEGFDERHALEEVGYKSKTEKEDLKNWQAKNKITYIKNGDLRNPVVEKSVAQAIKLVNAILENPKYNIDKTNWTVRIESTRELKKPKNEREQLRRSNTDKEKAREEYAKFLNQKRKEGKLSILKRDVYKYDSIINKFELWLEMGGDKDDPNYSDFKEILKLGVDKRIKHQLWLECNRICPYTGRVINLSTLFSSEVEVEHILPLSRTLDDSFSNKTLTFSHVNKEKGGLTAFEFMKQQDKLEEFKKRIQRANFSDAKIDNFKREDIPKEFTHAQLSNTSYIAKAVRNKILEVCKDVYFTNGIVTAELRKNDWKLDSILDQVRYEELTNVDIHQEYTKLRLYWKEFVEFKKKQANSTDIKTWKWADISLELVAEYEAKTNNPIYETWQEIEKFQEFRSKNGKKDRSDHRHHALDALITSLCSPAITQKLSTFNAQREKSGLQYYDPETGEVLRDKIELPISRNEIKRTLKDILVVNNIPQRLIVAKKNKSKKKGEEKHTVQESYSIRASLHKDTYYGKLKEPKSHLDQENKAIIGKPEAYVTRKGNEVWSFTELNDLDSIYDRDLKEIIKRRILWFKEQKIAVSKEAYEKHPLYRYSPKQYPDREPEKPTSKDGKSLPIVKKVRTFYRNYRSIIELPNNLYADSDGNYIMALYELKEIKKDKITSTKHFKILSALDAIKCKNKKQQLFPDEIEKGDKFLPLKTECPNLKLGDLVVMYEDEIDKSSIDWNNQANLKRRLFIVKSISSEEGYGLIFLLKHNISSSKVKYEKQGFDLQSHQNAIVNRHTNFNGIKVYQDETGTIRNI